MRREHFELPKSRVSVVDHTPQKIVKEAPRTFGNFIVLSLGTKEAVNALFGAYPGYIVVDIGATKMTLKREEATA